MIRNGVAYRLHYNYRGLPSFATTMTGGHATCTPSPFTGCFDVRWPGGSWGASLESTVNTTPHWFGSLAVAHRDDTGRLFRRNRYYDPAMGQFTQADPIGIAGGMNLYGYGNGDPVNFSDPFGLNPMHY